MNIKSLYSFVFLVVTIYTIGKTGEDAQKKQPITSYSEKARRKPE